MNSSSHYSGWFYSDDSTTAWNFEGFPSNLATLEIEITDRLEADLERWSKW